MRHTEHPDSLPFLTTAQSVTIAIADSEKNSGYGAEPGADLATYPSRHGANVQVEQLYSNGTPVAETQKSAALRNKADLPVIGAYSHSRIKEKIFGGVTDWLLDDPTIPLLVGH
ncbi:universal stress protein [Phyllobacterium sp. SB3]|uniref:universal stress protein n=1 Tax=Phyllobacterium sp. SB3 TaxID=3156073 RepID=UPI0032AEBBAB